LFYHRQRPVPRRRSMSHEQAQPYPLGADPGGSGKKVGEK
jgi:hypothetical protein